MSRNKRASIADLMSGSDETNVVAIQAPAQAPAQVAEPAAEDVPAPAGKPYKRVGLYLDPTVKREVETIAFTHERKAHDLYLEAIDLLFKKYGRPSIKQLTK